MRRGFPLGPKSYSPKSCAKTPKKRLNVHSLASLPVALCHASLAFFTRIISSSIACFTAAVSVSSIMGLRPWPSLVRNPSKPSARYLFTHLLTDCSDISVTSPTCLDILLWFFNIMTWHRIRKQYVSPLRNPFCSFCSSSSDIFSLVILIVHYYDLNSKQKFNITMNNFNHILMNKYYITSVNKERTRLISDTISFLKFPLAVLVVILHCDLTTKPIEKIGLSAIDMADSWYAKISWFLSGYIGSAAVPCFFVISGFLLFYNVRDYGWEAYKSKLLRRCKSLLVPYVVWCMIYVALYWIIGYENILFTEKPDILGGNLSISILIFEIFIKPLDGPLWFIRNLFAMVILSPVLYWIIKRTKFLLPLSLLILSSIIHHPIIESFLWFSFGISFAVNKFDFLYFCHKWLIFVFVFALLSIILDYIFYPQLDVHISRYFSIFKIMTVFGIGYWCVKKFPKISKQAVLNNSSFTIYAYHGIAIVAFLPLLYRLISKISHGGGDNDNLYYKYCHYCYHWTCT